MSRHAQLITTRKAFAAMPQPTPKLRCRLFGHRYPRGGEEQLFAGMAISRQLTWKPQCKRCGHRHLHGFSGEPS